MFFRSTLEKTTITKDKTAAVYFFMFASGKKPDIRKENEYAHK